MKSDIFQIIKEADQKSASFILPDFSFESALLKEGYRYIAGVDEAGRGSLAGPLTVGLTIYDAATIESPPDDIIKQIRDSKKLTHQRRLQALETIHRYCTLSRAEMVSHQIIDENNIVKAIGIALVNLLEKSPLTPDIILMDGTISFDVGIPMITVKKGDNRSFSIASASIEAKVTRDGIMDSYEDIHPGYGFNKNKGYGTMEHRNAIHEKGFCSIHRRTYEPVRSLIEGQQALFPS